MAILFIASHFELLSNSLQKNALWLRSTIGNHVVLAAVIYLALSTVFYNIPLPFAAIFKTLAGVIFGSLYGTVLNVTASALAAMLGTFVVRHVVFRDAAFLHHARLNGIHREIDTNGFWYVLACRFFMGVPFFLVNVAAGMSRIRIVTCGVATAVGVIPVSWLYAEAGSRLRFFNTISDLASPTFLFVLVALAAISALFPAVFRRIAKKEFISSNSAFHSKKEDK
ncbi:TVP38/TMEM64 family protein [Desulfovibrio inopinatus]|uniref:TVP38/TMEM64 family protein n=1 Tax=Desulfovibrio inopinatus TaxID=102109 RepID=UPI00146FC885|nr:VTT domain-containing protein [Desulfovibrio inopinatus]